MQKTKKNILGLCGLVLVAVMTVVAVLIPSPQASAVESVTDTIIVRVVEPGADINITSPISGAVLTSPEQTLAVSYANLDTATIEIIYTDKDGISHTTTMTETGMDYSPVDKTYPLDLSEAAGFGFGTYTIKISGVGMDGQPAEDVITFYYHPVAATVTEDKNTGDYHVDLTYTPDDGTEEGDGKVDKIVINILDQNGNPVGPSPIVVDAPATSTTFNLDDYNLPAGTYSVQLSVYDRHGKMLYQPYIVATIDYKTIPVPDTGAVLQNLNISKLDYLITGLIIFALIGVGSVIFIARRNRNRRVVGRRKH